MAMLALVLAEFFMSIDGGNGAAHAGGLYTASRRVAKVR